jgi:hypothetical protein
MPLEAHGAHFKALFSLSTVPAHNAHCYMMECLILNAGMNEKEAARSANYLTARGLFATAAGNRETQN